MLYIGAARLTERERHSAGVEEHHVMARLKQADGATDRSHRWPGGEWPT
jgi:hypothetical protein